MPLTNEISIESCVLAAFVDISKVFRGLSKPWQQMPPRGNQRLQMVLIAGVFYATTWSILLHFFVHLIEIKFPISLLSGSLLVMALTISIKVVVCAHV